MDKAEKIIKALCSDSHIETPDIKTLERLRDEELARDNPDFELIDEITKNILELKNIPETKIDIEQEIHAIKRRGIKRHGKIKISRFVSVAVVAVCLITANIFASPFIADGVRNFFPSIYTQNNKVFIDFNNAGEKNNSIEEEKEETEKYIQRNSMGLGDIKTFAETHGLNVYVPTDEILDQDYKMDISYSNTHDRGIRLDFQLEYSDDRTDLTKMKTLDLIYEVIDDKNLNNKIIEITDGSILDGGFLIDGMDAYVLFEEGMYKSHNASIYTMYFYEKLSDDKGILTIAGTIGFDHDQAYNIFKSFK
ncbi:MAG: hypothetical protein NC177_05860 [Ruminococcus flavefaciens]|nr:hypothetical protein [Ruminococcus flavefaciens]